MATGTISTSRIRILAGSSSNQLRPVAVNVDPASPPSSGKYPFPIKSDSFEGQVILHIQGYEDPSTGKAVKSEYFEREEREGITWSIQVQGRFLNPISTNDVLWGNAFDEPLNLPWGTSAVLQFATLMDPTLDHDLYAAKPWALSPLISSMPHLTHSKVADSSPLPPMHLKDSVIDNGMPDLVKGVPGVPDFGNSASARRAWFGNEQHRKDVDFGPDDVLEMDFCYGYLHFPTLTLSIPGGFTLDLKKYWNEKPLAFVCCERNKEVGRGPGKVFFEVVFELADEDEDEDGEEEDKTKEGPGGLSDDID